MADEEIKQLKDTIEKQKKLIFDLHQQLEQLRRQIRRSWENDRDYLPYDHEDRR